LLPRSTYFIRQFLVFVMLLLLLLLSLSSRGGGVTSVSCVMYVGLRKTDLHTVEPLVSEPCSFKDEFAV